MHCIFEIKTTFITPGKKFFFFKILMDFNSLVSDWLSSGRILRQENILKILPISSLMFEFNNVNKLLQ